MWFLGFNCDMPCAGFHQHNKSIEHFFPSETSPGWVSVALWTTAFQQGKTVAGLSSFCCVALLPLGHVLSVGCEFFGHSVFPCPEGSTQFISTQAHLGPEQLTHQYRCSACQRRPCIHSWDLGFYCDLYPSVMLLSLVTAYASLSSRCEKGMLQWCGV